MRPSWACAAALIVAFAALSSGCFGPDYPTAIPCSELQTCPPGQICDPRDLVCRVALTPGPTPDAAGGATPDAAGGAAPDAISGPVPEPCESAPCGPGTCMPAGEGYRCACDPGYVSGEQPGGETCVDLDECAVTPDPCAPGGVCVNGEDQYTCDCGGGYLFDGQTCTPAVIVGAGTADDPRQWSDGTTAGSCQEYRFPPTPYRYEGAVGDGLYRIAPPGRDVPVSVLCDMTTDGGGWTAIDPAAAVAFDGVARAVRAEGTIHTCQVQDGLLEAFYRRGTTTRLLVCQYDIDLGFVFDTVRVSGGADRLELVSMAAAGSVTDITNMLAQPWGENVITNIGDVVLGGTAHPGPVLSLGAALGLASGVSQSFAPGALLAWPREAIAGTTSSTVLRLHLSENGSEEEGYRWTGGRIYVRHGATLPGPAAALIPRSAHPGAGVGDLAYWGLMSCGQYVRF